MDNFKVLPGLPATGPKSLPFSATGKGKHREGFVVEFQPAGGEAWVGNFVKGLTAFSSAVLHPNGQSVIVVSGGQVYVVDPVRRELVETFGGMTSDLHPVPERGLLIFQTPMNFFAVNREGRAWKSRQLSMDGFRSVRIEGNRLVGGACDVGDAWVSFTIDLDSGVATGGPSMYMT